MDQELLKTNISALERKLTVLLNNHKGLLDEVKNLKNDNQTLREQLRQRDDQVNHFRNQIKITKIVDNIQPEDGSSSELRKTVDEYIREIDKCIAHLSR